MNTPGGDSAFPKPNPSQSGIKTVLKYTGIPPSWLDKRPSLPSRNWLIFLSVTSTVVGYYVFDRRQCKKIRQEYVDKVKHFAEVPMQSLDLPRKVTVYGTRWPGDEEYDRSMKYFRKYVKPVLVAAAVDYDMIVGKRHGDLATRIANDIRTRRRLAAGLDPPPFNPMNLPSRTPEEKLRRELEGGIVLVGRPTFKEFMAGLKKGWSDSLDVIDKEEWLSRDLESDGHFDEPEVESSMTEVVGDDEPIPTSSRLPPSSVFPALMNSPLRKIDVSPQKAASQPSAPTPAPTQIPPVPPLLLVHFVNRIGLSQIPLMIWDFFNERHEVQNGAESAYRLIMQNTRPFAAPELPAADQFAESQPPPSVSDLDFDKSVESVYKSSVVNSFLSEIQKARKTYYDELPTKLATARQLARREREPTKEEQTYPPPTEVELRAERMKKELRWRSDEQGWKIVRPEEDVEWDERFRGVLNVFVDPPSGANQPNSSSWGDQS